MPPSSSKLSEEALIARAVQGNADAFGDLYERYLARIYRYVFYRINDVAEAEDLTEMVFLKAWEGLGDYRVRDVPFGAWLYRIAHNTIIDRHRTRKKTLPLESQVVLHDTASDPEDRLDWHETIEWLAHALSQLSPIHQQVLALRFISGLSHAETALVLERSEEAARVLQHRALYALRELLAKSVNGDHGRDGLDMNLPLTEFEFETITINACGEITARARHTARQFRENLGSGVSLDMVEIPGGVFLMGSRAGAGYADERPQHSVKVDRFFLGKYPVTQEQWQAVMGRLPDCRGQGARRPVDRVSWNAAAEFCRRLSRKTGRSYRLPGEAEWEYACRARTTTPFHCGETLTTDLANYVGEHTYRSEPKGIYRHGTTEVGSFPPNAYGLYDMHGNIWEWCADAWHDDYVGAPPDSSVWQNPQSSARVLRGGGWHEPPDLCRCAVRLKQAAGEAEDLFGLRVACTLYDD